MQLEELRFGTELLKRGFAKMQKGGVIMDVTTSEQAVIAEEAGAVAVMALQAVPADIRKMGGVARMADPKIIMEIIDSVSIPVMAKVRIGHFAEAQILEAIGVDMIDESEVLTPADEFHVDKSKFTVPFVCGARNLGEALRRTKEGAAMIRTKGEAGTGDVREAVRHMRMIGGQIRSLKGMADEELMKVAREIEADYELVVECIRRGVAKINICTELQQAWLGGIEESRQVNSISAPGRFYAPAFERLVERIVAKIELFAAR